MGETDQALGVAGGVVPINSPQALAETCLRLLTDTHLWNQAQHAAITRVETYYNQQQMFTEYRELYLEGLS
jgi:glycosyltransferase involved in cell wall biosynthesis